jgi:signal transduction histidine kinase
MTSHPEAKYRWRYRWLSLGGVIAVMIAGAVIATVRSYNASREQLRTATRMLQDYAVFASFSYSQNATSNAHDRASNAYAGLLGFTPQSSSQLPPETIVLPSSDSCGPPDRSDQYRFRLDLPSRVLHVSRSSGGGGLWQALDHLGFQQPEKPIILGQRFATLLRDTLASLAATPAVREAGWGYVFVRDGSVITGLSYHPIYIASGQPIAVYGYHLCMDPDEFARLYHEVQPLPPSLVASIPRDSLLLLRVTGPTGAVLYSSGPAPRETRYAGATAVPLLADISFTVMIRSDLSSRILKDAASPSATRRALGLLVLTIGLGCISLVLFRREVRFVSARESFVTDVSHELRTPLQQILLFVQLLRLKRLQKENERARSLAIIETETLRLITLVANILDRTSQKPGQSNMQTLSALELIQNCITLFRPLAEARHVRITLSGSDARVTTNRETLHQILTNLLDNAVKYGPSGQTVRVSTEVSGEWFVIHVDDEGPGIPAGDRDKAWEPFVRLGSPGNLKTAGVGIGLAIVRTAVPRISGTIIIEDAPCGGARFTLRLPRADAGGSV